MKTKLVALSAALALLASATVCADQPSGRSSVYAEPGKSSLPPAKVSKTVPGNVRASVYARDLPATTPHGRGSRWHRDAGFARLI
jgi:hypothetical protein